MKKPYYLLLGIFLISNCTGIQDNKLDYELVKSEFQTEGCQPETDACLMIKMEYPRFDTGDSIAKHLANRIIKNSILHNIGKGSGESEVDLGIDEAILELANEFTELKKDFADYGTGWQADVSSKELYRSDSVLVLEVNSMTYFGGAHPNHSTIYYNFNRSKGNMIPLSTFVDDFPSFTNKAETAFRKANNLDAKSSLNDAGFQFLGDKFSLPANYAFLGDSIMLYYNPYEIAPYSMGDFEVTVSVK